MISDGVLAWHGRYLACWVRWVDQVIAERWRVWIYRYDNSTLLPLKVFLTKVYLSR